MEFGVSFLNSKIARRFCLLFISCAFLPTVALVAISYTKVVDQLEEQSVNRLMKESKAYGLSLFDRLVRIDHDLQAVGRILDPEKPDIDTIRTYFENDFESLYISVVCLAGQKVIDVFGGADAEELNSLILPDLKENPKPFIVSKKQENELGRVFLGVNILNNTKNITIVAELKPTYLWGIGPNPLLPPMTDLSVYDKNNKIIVSSSSSPSQNYADLKKENLGRQLRVFKYTLDGVEYFGSETNLFLESRFQDVGWIIILSQARKDIMSSIAGFKTTFPFGILLFLLLTVYLSFTFIRKGLLPLEMLKEGTKRVANQDFSTTVDIKSNDEFEDLGNAFNRMTTKLDQQFNALTAVGEIERAILSSLDRSKILASTLQRLKNFFHCDIALFVKKSSLSEKHLKIYLLQGRRVNDPRIEFDVLEEVENKELFSDQPHRLLNNEKEFPVFLIKHSDSPIEQALFLPLSVEGKVSRVLILGWKEKRPLPDDMIDQARQIANQLSIGLTNSRLMENMEKLAVGTIEALARTVDAKSKWTSGHSERVSMLSGQIADVMGLSKKTRESLTRGGLLHDIGKIAIPLTILDKPGSLTQEEFDEMSSHPEIGAKILEPIEAYQDILPVVVQHHEKFNGTGYPYGLKGDEIDLRARIMSVADVWDALVSTRPYREGWVEARAKKMIIDGRNSDFDPQVVDAFLAVVEGMNA